ncbi:MAG: cyclic nucleotide-binding domain-containing protein [Moorea sp. SIO2B7]|nr:cyclic nucleotide-binding domain-containing protein [Moorena sp. SIO2B7]
MSNLSVKNHEKFRQGSCLELDENICQCFPDLDRILEWCESQIIAKSKLRRKRFLPLAIRRQSLFPNADQVSKLMNYLKYCSFRQGEFLFRQGDCIDGIYFLESGQVSVILELPNQQVKRIITYQSGNTIGEMDLYNQETYSVSAITDKTSRLYFLCHQEFEKMEQEQPLVAASFHKFMMCSLVEHLNHRENELKHLLK